MSKAVKFSKDLCVVFSISQGTFFWKANLKSRDSSDKFKLEKSLSLSLSLRTV